MWWICYRFAFRTTIGLEKRSPALPMVWGAFVIFSLKFLVHPRICILVFLEALCMRVWLIWCIWWTHLLIKMEKYWWKVFRMKWLLLPQVNLNVMRVMHFLGGVWKISIKMDKIERIWGIKSRFFLQIGRLKVLCSQKVVKYKEKKVNWNVKMLKSFKRWNVKLTKYLISWKIF